eukprot:1484907-Prymnesium_polylepis.1
MRSGGRSRRPSSDFASTDLHALQTELDTLRNYRDTLHDTMKGLVVKAQDKVGDGETALAANLELVAAALGALSNKQSSGTDDSFEQLRREHESLTRQHESLTTQFGKQEEALSAASAELSRLRAEREAMLTAHAEDARHWAQEARASELVATAAQKAAQASAQAARRAERGLEALEAE